MISKETLTPDWLEKISTANGRADKILVEKVIRALLLLEGLAKAKLKFIFKGGTALMLLLDSARRLSIDIDIIMSDAPGNLDESLESFAAEQGFTRVEMQKRHTESTIEKAHYKFYYTPIHKSKAEEEAVLLDILFEANHYSDVRDKEIVSQFVIQEGEPIKVRMPSFEDLLGDKLTAFAPNTTGIPYEKNGDSVCMEIIKQMYDIGHLLDVAENVETIKLTFAKIAKTEIAYRNLEGGTPEDVLQDIHDTSLTISTRGNSGNGKFDELSKGIKAIQSFIFSEHYHIDKAIPHSAKAAYLSQVIATDQKGLEKFIDPSQVADAIIQQPHNTKLNKLKKSSPEAFFYWWKTTQLLDGKSAEAEKPEGK